MVVALIALHAAPPASAQPESDWDLSIPDARDDATVGGLPIPVGTSEEWDIVQAWVARETVSDVQVGVQLGRWQTVPLDVRVGVGRVIELHFAYAERDFRVRYPGGSCTGATLDGSIGTTWEPLDCLEPLLEAARGGFSVRVPKGVLVDATQHQARTGETLSNVHAIVHGLQSAPTGGVVVDRAPDEGGRTYDLRLGLQAPGDLDITSQVPIRHSNGGAASYLFQVDIQNRGDVAKDVFLTPEDVPQHWSVVAPPAQGVPPGGSVRAPVILAVQAPHAHGATETFRLAATDGESTVSMPLGLTYPAVPDPGGHHPTLFFHTVPQGINPLATRLPWMNPLPEDPSASATDEPFDVPVFPTDEGSLIWQFDAFLDPRLRQGLDFRVPGAAELALEIEVRAVATDAIGRAFLELCDPSATNGGREEAGCTGRIFTLASSGDVGLGDLPLGRQRIAFVLDVLDVADFVAFSPGADFRLRAEVEALAGGPISWHVDPSTLRLPLDDYFDPIELGVLRGDVTLGALADARLVANAGQRIRVPFVMESQGDVDRRVVLSVVGLHQAWAGVRPSTTVLPSGASITVDVLVDVPSDARSGDRADLFLLAELPGAGFGPLVHRVVVDIVDFPVSVEFVNPDAHERRQASTSVIVGIVALALAVRRR